MTRPFTTHDKWAATTDLSATHIVVENVFMGNSHDDISYHKYVSRYTKLHSKLYADIYIMYQSMCFVSSNQLSRGGNISYFASAFELYGAGQ